MAPLFMIIALIKLLIDFTATFSYMPHKFLF